MIIPKQSRVDLRYEAVAADRIGAGMTLVGIAVLLSLAIFSRVAPGPVIARDPALLPVLTVLVLALFVAGWSWWNNPERLYQHGHELRRDKQYVSASHAFDRAYSARHVPGQKAEALFWAGRSREFAQDHAAALERYRELASLYPDNYWVPESLYRTVVLERQAHNERGVENAYKQLLQNFPENTWTRKATKALAAKS